MTPIEVVVLSGLFTIVGSTIAWLLARRERKERDAHTSQTPSPPTTQEVWQRQDKLERVVRASVTLLSQVADQWPSDTPPVLSRRHVEVLAKEGYMPPEWDPQVQ